MLARLLLFIFAVTFLPMGIIFGAIGLLADDVDRGEPEAFVYLGAVFTAVGLVLAVAFGVLQRREFARRRRRRAGLRTTAEVVERAAEHERPQRRAGQHEPDRAVRGRRTASRVDDGSYDASTMQPYAGRGRETIEVVPSTTRRSRRTSSASATAAQHDASSTWAGVAPNPQYDSRSGVSS